MKDIYLEQTEKSNLLNLVKREIILDDLVRKCWKKVMAPSNIYHNRNKSVEWLDNDEKLIYNPRFDNIKVIHNMDENGYRIYPDYFPTSNKTVFCFGCSETFGWTTPENETWPYLLARKLGNWNVKNYGLPGGSMESIARTCFQIINSLKKEQYPEAIYFLLPDCYRSEYIGNFLDKCGVDKIGHRTFVLAAERFFDKNKITEKNQIENEHVATAGKVISYYKYTSKVHSFFETVKYFRYIQETLISKGIQWYWYTWAVPYCKFSREDIIYFFGDNTILDENGLIMINEDEKTARGRDNIHRAIGYHDPLTDELVKLYKSNI